MAVQKTLWHFSTNVDPSFPGYVDAAMFKGQYVSQYGYDTAVTAPSNLSAGKSGKVTNGFMKAFLRMLMVETGAERDGAGMNADYSVSEFTDVDVWEGISVGKGSLICTQYAIKTGVFRVNKGTGVYNTAKDTAAPLIMALWPLLLKMGNNSETMWNELVSETLKRINQNETMGDSQYYDLLCSTACYMADSLYYMEKNNVIAVCAPAEVKPLSVTKIKSKVTQPAEYIGVLQEFTCKDASRQGRNQKQPLMLADQLLGAFAFRDFSADPLTEEQQKLVPHLSNDYVVSETLLLACKHIKETTNRPAPVRNLLLIGEPGTGKTEMCVAIASALGLPLYRFAANATTEPYDLFGQFVPVDNEGNADDSTKVSINEVLTGLPSAEEISIDPVWAYQQITGLYKADASCVDCMAEAFKVAQEHVDKSDGEQRFTFAPGQLVYAMRYGGVWAFDEVTLPQNAGVVPALNPAMDSTQSITLPNGEVLHRHPSCVFIGTTNIDLEGCRMMNQAWKDRCQLIINVEEPDDEELISRVKAMTGFDDAVDGKIVNMDQFVNAYHELKAIAKRHRLSDGTIGPRKLRDWVVSTLVMGDPVKAAMWTIIPGATQDEKGIAEMAEKISDLF